MISTEDLESLITKGDANVRVLDCSVARGRKPEDDTAYIAYLKCHIAGAAFVNLDDLRDMGSDLPFMMPTEKHFTDTMRLLNVRMTDRVICYDSDAMQLFGYRAAWMFQAMGHKNVQVLNGGLPKWIKEGRKTDSESDAVINNDGFDYKLNENKIYYLKSIQAFHSDETERTYQLLDARGPD